MFWRGYEYTCMYLLLLVPVPGTGGTTTSRYHLYGVYYSSSYCTVDLIDSGDTCYKLNHTCAYLHNIFFEMTTTRTGIFKIYKFESTRSCEPKLTLKELD